MKDFLMDLLGEVFQSIADFFMDYLREKHPFFYWLLFLIIIGCIAGFFYWLATGNIPLSAT